MIRLYIFIVAFIFTAPLSYAQKIAGPLQRLPGTQEGLVLFAPLNSTKTYLIDDCGRVINVWNSEFLPGNTVNLLPNGNLLRTNRLNNLVITGGGGGGGAEILDWNSTKLWSFTYNTDVLRQHHDAIALPNGNVLMIVWDLKSKEDAIAQGRNPNLLADNVVWSERIIEVKPILPDKAEVIWEWSLWDHLIQDYDPTKSNYGVVSEHPELVDINFTSSATGDDDWIHANSVDYNEDLDQIVISSPFLNELWIIDHSTTLEQVSTHEGGAAGKGGDLLYRWGNPLAYKKGTIQDQKLFGQHDVNWVDSSYPYGGQIIVFNNEMGENFSTVDILNPPINEAGDYILDDGVFGPSELSFRYSADPPESLYSGIMSGAEVLPNGNILICSSLQGKFIEVSPQGEIVWEYKSPITTGGIVGRDFITDQPFVSDRIFRAKKYPLDYPAFAGKNLVPGEPIEGEPWACEMVTSTSENTDVEILIYPSPVENELKIKSNDSGKLISARLMTVHGSLVASMSGYGEVMMDVSTLGNGIYVVVVDQITRKIIKIN